jgi:hypothetical protein
MNYSYVYEVMQRAYKMDATSHKYSNEDYVHNTTVVPSDCLL